MFFSCPAHHFQQRPLAHTQIALKLFGGVVVDVKKMFSGMGWYFRGCAFKASVRFCLLHVLTSYVYGGTGCLPEYTEKHD